MIRQVLRIRGRRFFRSRIWRDQSGAAALEFALTAPTLFLLIFGGIEFGRLLWTQSALQMSVAQAERCYAWQVSGCATASAVQTFAANVAPQLQFSTSTFALSPGGCVTASYPYSFIVKGLFPWTPTLTASACFSTI
jgi:Flp pilus assembly protein TadG